MAHINEKQEGWKTDKIFKAWPPEPEADRATRGPKRKERKGLETALESKARNNYSWAPI